MLNRRNYTRNGHDWIPMPDMLVELDSLRGVRILEGGSRKGRFGRTTRTPSGYGPVCNESNMKIKLSSSSSHQYSGSAVRVAHRTNLLHPARSRNIQIQTSHNAFKKMVKASLLENYKF